MPSIRSLKGICCYATLIISLYRQLLLHNQSFMVTSLVIRCGHVIRLSHTLCPKLRLVSLGTFLVCIRTCRRVKKSFMASPLSDKWGGTELHSPPKRASNRPQWLPINGGKESCKGSGFWFWLSC